METKLKVDAQFKAADKALEELVKARRDEVVRMQKAQADQLADVEKRGEVSMAAWKKSLPKEMASLYEAQEKANKDAVAATKYFTDEIKEKLLAAAPKTKEEVIDTSKVPLPANAVGFFTPYYGTLHGSDGKVYYQGYNPGNIDLSDFANGGGSGLFGTGAGSFTVYMDWWFTFRAPQNRNYAHTITVPFHGFYIIKSDDGFWDSKEAHARIDISAVGYQYNYKATGTTNVFDIDSQNINVNDRFDGARTMYYSDLLGADQAYLRVTASFYVYARGGGSTAQLDFSSGSANYIGVPTAYVV